ncbi:hypothetical protein QUF75_19205 [Desulfococcaceae bacterium HSG7]|nr:hypothetical protein [Desulfococcaceae bacterium HSG7]
MILIGAIVGVGYISRNALFTLLDRYSGDFKTFAVYAGFVVLSLIAAVVMFGIMRSSGMFKKTGKQAQYEFGGAMAGFMATLIFLITSIPTNPSMLIISGNVRFVVNGQVTGPADNAKISISGVSGFKTETDSDGNFMLKLPSDLTAPQIEIQVVYNDTAPPHYQKITLAEAANVIIEVPEVNGNKNPEPDNLKNHGKVEAHGPDSPAVVAGGDVNITYGDKGASRE